MSVSWSDNTSKGDTNRFANKHLHVVQGITDMNTMISEGQKVLRDRNKNRSEAVVPVGGSESLSKGEVYGKIKPTQSSLIVTNTAGLASLESWVDTNALSSGKYTIPVNIGAIIQCELAPDGSIIGANDTVTTCGSMTVSIDVSAGKKVVYHLCGVDMTGGQLRSFKLSPGGVAFVA